MLPPYMRPRGMGVMFTVMYNACYGGFSFSEKAMREYHRRMGTEYQPYDHGTEIDRMDTVMIEIVKEMGTSANSECAKIELRHLPMRFYGFYEISEYDGQECVSIDVNRWKLAIVAKILKGMDQTLETRVALNVIEEDPIEFNEHGP